MRMAELTNVKRETSICTHKGDRPSGRYCLPCHAKYMRAWRSKNPMTVAQKKKDTTRSYANVYLRRGKLKRSPCETCGDSVSQMHHDDYDKPLKVRWLCRPCHLALHATIGVQANR